ncbi:hypothetical protein GGX14DRAFT_576587 [Mycena pura]|uniref:Uncharacterized protein n=1 Tax=Mycena pura TaxID=153505 RepID=A0AAD6Y308_9AGAR|nr:hypothetical protein GGX14DRAFT_576587 [Mycena pura]
MQASNTRRPERDKSAKLLASLRMTAKRRAVLVPAKYSSLLVPAERHKQLLLPGADRLSRLPPAVCYVYQPGHPYTAGLRFCAVWKRISLRGTRRLPVALKRRTTTIRFRHLSLINTPVLTPALNKPSGTPAKLGPYPRPVPKLFVDPPPTPLDSLYAVTWADCRAPIPAHLPPAGHRTMAHGCVMHKTTDAGHVTIPAAPTT